MLQAAQTLLLKSTILRFTRWEKILDGVGLSGRVYFELARQRKHSSG